MRLLLLLLLLFVYYCTANTVLPPDEITCQSAGGTFAPPQQVCITATETIARALPLVNNYDKAYCEYMISVSGDANRLSDLNKFLTVLPGTNHPDCTKEMQTKGLNKEAVCGINSPLSGISTCQQDISYCGCNVLENTYLTPQNYSYTASSGALNPSVVTYNSAFSSCSCNGKCILAKNNGIVGNTWNIWQYSPPLGRKATSGSWPTCLCHDDWYGERCQYHKTPYDIAGLVAGNISIENFPFLPWYQTQEERNNWLQGQAKLLDYSGNTLPIREDYPSAHDQLQANGIRSFGQSIFSNITGMKDLSGNYMWANAKSVVARQQDSKTIWAWPGYKQSCPYGMIAYGTYVGDFTDLFWRYYNDMESISYYFADSGNTQHRSALPSADRRWIMCMCDPTQVKNGCSNRGLCHEYINTGNTFLDGKGIADRSIFPPTIGMFPPKAINNYGDELSDISGQVYLNGYQDYPDKWALCECEPDYLGIYCEIDNRKISLCGDAGDPTPSGYELGSLLHTTGSSYAYNPYDDPGDCYCNLARNQTIHLHTGTPSAHTTLALTGKPNTLSYLYKNVIYPSQTPNPTTHLKEKKRFQGLCIPNKDLTVCNGRGTYNSVVLTDPTGTVSYRKPVGCECDLYSDKEQKVLYPTGLISLSFNSNTTIMDGLAGGPNCVSTCRLDKCNGHGVCQYITRSDWLHNLTTVQGYSVEFLWDVKKPNYYPSTTGFWPTEDSQYNEADPNLTFQYRISDTCKCDTGFNGQHCSLSDVSGTTCNGYALDPVLAQTTCKSNCRTDISYYDDSLYRCIGNCTRWIKQHPNDITGAYPNGLECGGPQRGICNPFDSSILDKNNTARTCSCLPGYSHPELGCSLSICPHVYDKLCGGQGECRLQPHAYDPNRQIGRCYCKLGWMGDACEIQDNSIVSPSDTCQRNTQQVNNRIGMDWVGSNQKVFYDYTII